MKVTGITHICLSSSDLERTEKFYCDTLGFKLKYSFLRGDKCIGLYIEVAPLQFIEVFVRDGAAKNIEPLISHVSLEVEDIMETTKFLHERGIATRTPAPKPCADGSWQLWCEDPDGTPIEFHQFTEESRQFAGETVSVAW